MWSLLIPQHEAWMIAAGRRPGTIAKRVHYLTRLSKAFPDPATVTTADLLTYSTAHEWQPETRKAWRSTVVTFWQWAIDYGFLTSNPASKLPRVSVPRTVPKPVPDNVYIRAISQASTRDQTIIRMAALAGMRRAEIAEAKWSDIVDGKIYIKGKGGHIRAVPLVDELAADLAEEQQWRKRGILRDGWRYHVDTESEYIFPGPNGHISADAIGRILKRALGDDWTGHKLRHRFGTKIYSGSRDLLTTQQLLGHSRPETTQRYILVPEDYLKTAAEYAALFN